MSNTNTETKAAEEQPTEKKDDFGLKQLLAPVLISLAGLGSGYLLMFKPLQDTISRIGEKMAEQDERIQRLEKELRSYKRDEEDEEEERKSMRGIEPGERYKRRYRSYPKIIE
jgi:hypothetical protein